VRQLNLRTGVVGAIGSRQKVAVPEETMRGTRHSHILSPDKTTLYTLYTNQPEHLHSRDLAAGLPQSSGDYYAFVHVLKLSEGWAFCLDLPQPFGVGPASGHALALSPDGQWLYVADRSSGAVALASTRELTLRGVGYIDANLSPSSAAATVGPDYSLFLSDTSDVLVLDPKTFAVQRRLPVRGTPTGMALSPDGQRLFVTTHQRLIALDVQSGFELGEISADSSTGVQHVSSSR
jgi:hypothetical protein